MLDVNQEGQTVAQPPMMKTNPTLSPEQASVPASLVASTFVEQYYRTLGNAPHQLHRFYSNDSVFARLEPGDALSMDAESKLTVLGQVAIHAKIRDQSYKNCKALIDTIDFQDSFDGSVIVLITGYISNNGAKPRPFTQSILLARQDRGGYYVRNDILRFVQRNQDKNVPAPSTDAPSTDAIQPGFVPDIKTPSVVSDNAATSDVCSEGPKENVSDTMEQVEEFDSTPQPEISLEQDMKVEQVEPEPISVEPVPLPEPSVAPAVPSKPASWASLFTNSTPAPAPSATQPAPTSPIQSPSTQSPPTPSEFSSKTPDYSSHIFVQNLPESSTEAEISSLFSAYGPVDCVDILPKRTLAFVIFENAQGAQAALNAKTIMLQGRDLQVSARKPRSQYNNRGRGRGGRGRHVAARGRNNKHEERQQL